MESKSSGISVNKFEIKLINAGKGLLLLPSSTSELQSVLQQIERCLVRVRIQPLPSESLKYAMQPIIEALIAKELMRHPDLDVNISVGCCISEVLRIMDRNTPYNNKQMKDFFELAVITFEKLSSTSGGCYTKMTKVLKSLNRVKFSVLMSECQLDGLVVRLFKQFLTDADSNSSAIESKMKRIMTKIIEESELLNPELVDILVKSVRKENQIASPICWQLGEKVLKNCATQLNPHLPYEVAKEVYGSLRETIPSPTHKRKLECVEGLKNSVQPVRRCQESTKHTVKLLGIHSKDEKITLSLHDPSMPTKSVTKAQSVEHGESLVGSKIMVWWPEDQMCNSGVVKFFDGLKKKHKVLYDSGDEELLDLNCQQWKLLESVSTIPDSALSRTVSSQAYKVKQSVAPILEAIFKKHGDIAANCIFKTNSVRASLFEVVCEVVKRIQNNDVTTLISEIEEIKCQVSDAEVAKINVSWLRAHLEAVYKINDAMKKSVLLIEMKSNTVLVKRAAQIDLKQRHVELVDAQKRFEQAKRSVKVLDLVEKKLNDIISKCKTEKDSWVKEPIFLAPHKKFSRKSQCGAICVKGYKVKQSAAPILEAIFKKHGDIAVGCVFQAVSVRASFLELVCEVVTRIQNNDFVTFVSEMDEIECRVSDAEAAKLNVTWLRAHLEAVCKRNDAMKMSTLLMEVKVKTVLVKRAGRMDLKERRMERMDALERFEKAERCVDVLDLVEKKVSNNILECKAEIDSWGKEPII